MSLYYVHYPHGMDECVCVCHTTRSTMLHVKPCCHECPHCHRKIKDGVFVRHENECVPVTIVDGDTTRNPGAATWITEETIIVITPYGPRRIP